MTNKGNGAGGGQSSPTERIRANQRSIEDTVRVQMPNGQSSPLDEYMRAPTDLMDSLILGAVHDANDVVLMMRMIAEAGHDRGIHHREIELPIYVTAMRMVKMGAGAQSVVEVMTATRVYQEQRQLAALNATTMNAPQEART